MKNLVAVPVPSGTIHIDTAEIPAYVGQNIAQIAFRGILRAYNDPVIYEDFLRWKKEREKARNQHGT